MARRTPNLPRGACSTGENIPKIHDKILKSRRFMIKPEWGSKHSCPKCGTRFYDLGEDDPVTCIQCGNSWTPEPVLKSKQPLPFEEEKKKTVEKEEVDLAEDDLDIDDDGDSPDNDVDLGGDDDLGVAASDDEDDES